MLEWDNCQSPRGIANIPTAGQLVPGWNPSSSGGNWTQQVTSGQTCGNTATSLTTTGSVTAGIFTLDTQVYRDGSYFVSFSKTGVADVCEVIIRFQNVNNFYAVGINNNVFQIRKVVGGTNTIINSTAFTDGGAQFNIKVQTSGYGVQGPNIQAKVWLQSNPESTATLLSATDGSLIPRGMVGVRMKGNAAGNTQSLFSFTFNDNGLTSLFATPTNNTKFDFPFGYTINEVNNQQLQAAVVTDLVPGLWLRWQLAWNHVEYSPGLYDWSMADDAVWKCNTAGVNFLWNIQTPPTWRQTLDGYGNPGIVRSAIGPGVVTSIPVNTLPAGCYIQDGAVLKLGFGLGTVENVTVSNGGNFVGAGATSIPIQSVTLVNAHAVGELCIDGGGLVIANAADWAGFCSLAAQRYNPNTPFGIVNAWQIENEQYDSNAVRIGSQILPTPPIWNGNAAFENGGAILAPVFNAAANAIRVYNPDAVVLPCAVRATPTYGQAHRLNWSQGFALNATAKYNWFDFHYYRNSTEAADGTPVLDPSLSVSNLTGNNELDVANHIGTYQGLLGIIQASGGQKPQILMGETGWDKYSDGLGDTETTTAARNAGTAYTTLAVGTTVQQAQDGFQIFVDTLGPHPEVVYSYGNQVHPATTLQITTDPRGKAVNNPQLPWTPAFTHNSGVTIYIDNTTEREISPQLDAQYIQSCINAALANNARMFYFTLDHNAVTNALIVPPTTTNGSQKGLFQTINGTPTYLNGFFTINNAATQLQSQPAMNTSNSTGYVSTQPPRRKRFLI